MSARIAQSGMDDQVEMDDPGNTLEVAAFAISKVEPLGSFTRLYFTMPKTQFGKSVNSVVLTMIVPTDQVGTMSRALGIDCGPREERRIEWNTSGQTGTC